MDGCVGGWILQTASTKQCWIRISFPVVTQDCWERPALILSLGLSYIALFFSSLLLSRETTTVTSPESNNSARTVSIKINGIHNSRPWLTELPAYKIQSEG